MAAYLYVLWAIEDELVKLGKTIRFNKRPSEHNGNSSNPLKFTEWKLYRFDSQSDASKIEALTKKTLAARGLSYRDKQELFECSPVLVTETIDKHLQDANIFCLRNFPFDLTSAFETFANFPTLPEYALEIFTPEQRKLYWKGISDALNCFRYFEGINVRRSDLLALMGHLNTTDEPDREFWPAIVDYYRNNRSDSFDKQEVLALREIAEKAREDITNDRRNAFADWQEIED